MYTIITSPKYITVKFYYYKMKKHVSAKPYICVTLNFDLVINKTAT